MKVPIRRYWALLHEYLAAQRWPVALLAALVVAGVGLQLAVPQVMSAFIDAADAGWRPSSCCSPASWSSSP